MDWELFLVVKLQPVVEQAEEIRAASIHVKSVNFRAAPELMSRMKEARFEREE